MMTMPRIFFNPFTGLYYILRRKPRKAPVNKEVERLRAQAKQLADEHGFTYNRVAIKNNVSNWGSCSSKGNINLNLRLVTLPDHLRDYVMLHELCHLKYLNHGPQFHALLESVCPGHKACEKELKTYKITAL